MRALLDACCERGEPVAYLWATEDTIYGRFGFGLASFTAEIDLARERSGFHAPFAGSGRVQLVSPAAAEEFLAPIYERVAVETPGMFARTSTWCARLPIRNGDAEPVGICNVPSSRTKVGRKPMLSIG